jgi:formylglycine-generating enzyme required for sulfatase activity
VTGTCTGAACAGATTGGSSCEAGLSGSTLCGAVGESCCTSIEVPGGTYERAYDLDPDGGVELAPDGGPSQEANPAAVTGFRLDKYLVTVGRFRQFVAAVFPGDGLTGWSPPDGSGKHSHLNGGQGLKNLNASVRSGAAYETGWVVSDDSSIAPTDANLDCHLLGMGVDGGAVYSSAVTYATWTSEPGSQEEFPIDCVNWYEAYAFCIWDGGFLPSETEWGYAAAGGAQQREYPWGSTGPGSDSNYATQDCLYGGLQGDCTGGSNVEPVGTAAKGAGLWGQLDLVGEVYEWTLDAFAAYADPCVDGANLAATSEDRSIRGPDVRGAPQYLMSSPRYGGAPTERYAIGFRCARTP